MITRESVIKRMHDEIDYYALRAECEELTIAQGVAFATEISNALKMISQGEISRAEGFVNRAAVALR